MMDSAQSSSGGYLHLGCERQDLRPFGEVVVGSLGIIGTLDFHKTLTCLVETYIAPAERDYRTY